MKALAHELGTEVAPADPNRFAAAFHHRGDAGQASQLLSRGPSVSIRADHRQQARSINISGAGQGLEQGKVRMGRAQFFNLPVKLLDGCNGGLHLRGQGFDHQDRRVDDGAVGGQGQTLLDGYQSFLERVRAD